jgi:hypothetical protein
MLLLYLISLAYFEGLSMLQYIPLDTSIHMHCFCFLAIMSRISKIIYVKGIFLTLVFISFWYLPYSSIAGSCGLTFKEVPNSFQSS